MTYRVFIATEVIAKTCRPEQLLIIRLDELTNNPFRAGDYAEADEIGRPIVDLKPAGA